MDIPFLKTGEQWPPASAIPRLESYRSNRKYYRGEHVPANILNANIPDDKQKVIQLAVGLPGAISRVFSDLLFQEAPEISTEDKAGQEWIDGFRKRVNLDSILHKAGDAQSFRGDAIMRLYREEDQVGVDVISAESWFPLINGTTGRIAGHLIAWKYPVGKVEHLHVEIHTAGLVEYREYAIESKGGSGNRIGKLIDEGIVETGVDELLVFRVPNIVMDDDVFGMSDYHGAAAGLFDEMGRLLSQVSEVLRKHADPTMIGSRQYKKKLYGADQRTVVAEYYDMSEKFLEVIPGEQQPQYLTWDGHLSDAFTQMEKLMNAVYFTTDTNPTLFSLIAGGDVPSGSALRKMLMRPMARRDRKAMMWAPALRDMVRVAYKLETGVDIDVTVEFRDGIPADPREEAEVMQIRTGGKPTISVSTAIGKMQPEWSEDEVSEEVSRIGEDEANAAAPSILGTRVQTGGEE